MLNLQMGLLENLQAVVGEEVLRSMRNDSITIHDLQCKMAELNAQARTLQATADAEGRPLNEAETEQVDAIMNEFDAIQEDVARRERMNAQAGFLNEGSGRQTTPEQPGSAENAIVEGAAMVQAHQGGIPASKSTAVPRNAGKQFSRVEDSGPSRYGKNGFYNMGEFAVAVRNASLRSGGYTDPRLVLNAPTSVSTEGVNADGGYAVPPDFREEIMRKVLGEASIVGYTDQQTSSSKSMSFPSDETTPWQSTGGIRVNWTGEGAKIAESKVSLNTNEVKLEKLTAMVPVTEELLEDAPAIGRYLGTKVPENMGFALNDAIVNGTGTGQPVGILSAANTALLTVGADVGQVADSITYSNIVKMWSSMYARGRSNAVWLAAPTIDEALMLMTFPSTTSTVPVYLPPNGAAGAPYATLFGRPIIPTECCPDIGDKGDLILADLSKYMTLTKTSGMRADVSMHLYFDYDIQTFRFIMRFGGKPWWKTPITGKTGNRQYSAFVALAERAGA